jgi:RHS repeat-associated protein
VSNAFGAQTITNTYPSAGQGRPHAIQSSSLWTGATFGYDAVGNVTRHPQGGEIEYTPFNLPRRITGGPQPMAYLYDAFGTRVMKESIRSDGTWSGAVRSIYVGELFERRWDVASQSDIYYVRSPERTVAQVRRDVATGTETTTYLYSDHLGSTEVTQTGDATPEYTRRDPFGQKLAVSLSGAMDPRLSAPPPGAAALGSVTAGFTGHEMDDELGLVNMKGRIYDPRIGRFLQADPLVQAPLFSQSHNRYTYVFNNPVNLWDPTGYAGISDWIDEWEVMETDGDGGYAIFYHLKGDVNEHGHRRFYQGATCADVGQGDDTCKGYLEQHAEHILSGIIGEVVEVKQKLDPGGLLVPVGVPGVESDEEEGPAWWQTTLSIGVGFLPGVGTVQSLSEVVLGRDLITGEKTSRWWAAAGMVAGLLPGGKGLLKAAGKVDDVGKLSKGLRSQLNHILSDKVTKSGEAAVERAKNIAKGIPESQLGPSGKPKIHVSEHATRKGAHDAAQERSRRGQSPEEHSNPTTGKPHYHPSGSHSREHHTYPKKKGYPGNEKY